jgi:hypothetical protein
MAHAVKPSPKIGDELIDQDAMATRRQKVTILHGIMSDVWHVRALYDCFLSRMEARHTCSYADDGERFPTARRCQTGAGIGIVIAR